MLRISAAALRALLASLCCALIALACAVVAAPSSAAPTTRAAAERAALRALRAERGSAPLIVFRGGKPLKAGTRIASAGLEQLPRSLARSARTRAELLAAAGVQIVKAPQVARLAEPAWFFYADEAPFQAYQHRGRIALVGVRSGEVTVSRRFSWPPLLNGRLPYFLRSYAGYRNPRARAFTRLWTPKKAARAKGALASPLGPLATAAQTTAPTPAQRRVAGALADEGACTIRVGDTLGNFFDASSFDRTRSLFGGFFNELAQADGRFVSARYRVTTGTTLRRYVERLIAQRGCRDLLLYVAGGGYLRGEPAISVGIKGRRDGRVEQQLVTAASLRALISANPGARFHLLLDAPGSGGFLTRLSDLPNLKLFLASSRAGQASFTALPGRVAVDGTQLGNGYNRDGLLEFSNRGLQGLRCFRDDAAEVGAALAAKAQGLTPSFLAWMLRRAYALCGEGSLLETVPDAPRAQLETPGYRVVPPDEVPTPTPPGPKPPAPGPDPDPPLPPGPKNVAPTAAPVAVATEEDTPVAVTLLGADSDGDALAYTTATPVPGGTVSGDGAARTFTPAPDFHGTATFAYTVSDGRESTTATVTVTVTPVDDAPVVDPGAGAALYEDGEPAVAAAPALTVTDVDDAQLDGATVEISGGYEEFGDRLAFSDQNGISGAWDGPSGTLTLTGEATVAEYEAALRTVAFDSVLPAPSEAPRTLTFAVENEAASAPATRGLTVDFREAPSIGGAGATQNWTEGDAPLAIYPDATVGDPDSTTLASARVHFSGPRVSDADELVFADQGGITGSWDATAGVLTLTGPAPLAAWQAALRTVAFRNLGDDPGAANRTIAFQVSDGARSSNGAYVQVAVTPVDDPPRLSAGGGSPAYTEGDATGVVVDPLLELTDPDSATLSGAAITISGGFDAAGDELLFSDAGAISGAWDGPSGRLTLTGTATVADYRAALRSVRFRNTSDDPADGPRTISFTASDATGASTAVTTTVAFTPVDDAPVVTTGGGATKWEGADVAIDGALTVADVDSTQLSGATVRVSGGYVASADELVFATQSGISGSWDALTGTLTLTGTASLADWQSALRTVAYRHNGPLLDGSQRTISFTVSNALGSAAATKAVVFGDAPQVDLPGTGLAYTENDPATAVDPGATVTDADDTRLDGATVAITAGHAAGQDVLSATTAGTAIAASYDGTAGTLELTGDDTVAHYQQVLRTVAYANTSENPSIATRTLEYAASDGVLNGSDTTTVTVTAVDDAPILTTSGGSADYVEDDATGVVVDPGLTVSDVDSASLTRAVVQVASGHVAAEDRLLFTDQNGIGGTWSAASGTLTLTGSASVAEYQAALRSVRYVNDDTVDPSTATRTVSFAASDDSSASAASSRQVTVRAVNDAPQISSGATRAYTENDPATAIDPALTLTDGDSARLAGATVTLGTGHAAGEDVLGFVNQNGITGSFSRATGLLTLSGSATVAQYRDALRSVTYANSSEDPSDADRTVTFAVDDGGAVDNTASATATIEVTKVNDAPVAPNATASAVGNTPLYANTAAPAGIAAKTATGAAANVLTGSTDVDGPGPLQVDVAASATSGDRGGTVAWNADGSYVYRPAAGFTGSERVAFAVTDQGSPARTTSATLTVTVAERVFYVDNEAPAGGDGRAETPFATLAAADTAANATGDTVYVFRGDGTTTGLGGGFTLLDDQRLLGETRELVVGGSTLFAGTASATPSIGGTIALASGNAVRGLRVLVSDPGAAAVEGGSGDSSGLLADLDLTSDAGDALRLSGTSGTWTVQSVQANTNGGTGIVLTNAGTVDFVSPVGVQAPSSAGIAFSGTRTSGQISPVMVNTSGRQTGISVTDGTGSLDLPIVVVETRGVGIALASSEGVQIGRLTPSQVTAGETAVLTTSTRALTAPPRIELESATSLGGTHGLRLGGLGASGSFRAATGLLSGQTVSALTVDGGAGTVEYGGAIGNGSGLSAQVLNRTGGSVTVSGAITDSADAGGGIAVTGGNGGATQFNADITLSTGADPALRFTAGSGQSLALGGNLDLATTTGAAFEATGSGGLAAPGSTNRIVSTGGGQAVRIAGTTIAAAGVTFRSIAQSGGANAIVLDGTGTTGAFRVTGIGTSSGSGGTIQYTTGAAVLVDDANAQLANQTILGAGDDGIRVSADSGAPTVSITDADIDSSAGDHIQVTSGSGSTASPTVTVERASLTGPAAGGGFGGGVVVNPGGTGNWNVTVQDSVIIGADGDAITVDTPGSLSDPQPATVRATLLGNTIGAAGFAGSGAWSGSGIAVRSNGGATVRTRIAHNTVARYATNGIALIQNDGRGALHATVDNNTIANPDGGGAPVDGIYAVAGGAAADDGGTLCVDVGRQVPNTLTSAAAAGGYGIWLRQRDLSTIQLPQYAGGARDAGAIQAHLLRYQPGVQVLASPGVAGGGFVNAPGGCTQP